MRTFRLAAFMFLLCVSATIVPSAYAADTDPLFVNSSTDDAHRAKMVLSFTKNQQIRKHPVTVYLSDKGVLIASKANAAKFEEQQKLLTELMSGGATVIICPLCMKHYGVNEADLLPGIKLGNPELVGAALFQDKTRTLSW